jgi:SAM-dependent methyltransferase
VTEAETLDQLYNRDRVVWDECAETYEARIVGGHPDVLAYEAFEEDLLDRTLLHLIRECGRKVSVYDVGCGSARLHLRYGLKTVDPESLGGADRKRVLAVREGRAGFAADPLLASGIDSVAGIDFSAKMIELAERKLADAGLGVWIGGKLLLKRGSAFELEPMESDPLPVAVSVCNSIGVMQGPAGASQLFRSMRRAVESAGGVAIVSAYRGEAVETYALGNYESTMDVCGQPRWLEPVTYAGGDHIQIPRAYKRAHDPDPGITVDVFAKSGERVERGHRLHRNPDAVRETVRTGHIRTWSDYESRWYAWDRFDEWIREHWDGLPAYHLAGQELDSLRAEPAQLAVLDPRGFLEGLIERWRR